MLASSLAAMKGWIISSSPSSRAGDSTPWHASFCEFCACFGMSLYNLKETQTRAVLGHWLFGYIHPYPDGNGRVARFLTNALLASGG